MLTLTFGIMSYRSQNSRHVVNSHCTVYQEDSGQFYFFVDHSIANGQYVVILIGQRIRK